VQTFFAFIEKFLNKTIQTNKNFKTTTNQAVTDKISLPENFANVSLSKKTFSLQLKIN
jgi:hypothetical protein